MNPKCGNCQGDTDHLYTRRGASTSGPYIVNQLYWCKYCGTLTEIREGERRTATPEQAKMLAGAWQHEAHVVASVRRDGTAPTLEKVIDERFFLVEDAAKGKCDEICREIGPYYGVFPVTVVIPKKAPTYRPGGPT